MKVNDKNLKIGIVGYGNVGKAMHKLFKKAYIYDINGEYSDIKYKQEINNCDVVFICVPTPMNSDGSCDISCVEEVISWCNAKLLILRSTVYVGCTDYLKNKYNKKIIFQPEYYGETVDHPFVDLSQRQWLSFGGDKSDFELAIIAYQQVINANIKIYFGTAKEVEMAKYMENSFFAMKVIFCNEMYDFCQKLNIDYNQVREIWLADPRIGRYHTFVYKNLRGFGGSCLPKDISSIKFQMDEIDVDNQLISSVINKNKKYQNN